MYVHADDEHEQVTKTEGEGENVGNGMQLNMKRNGRHGGRSLFVRMKRDVNSVVSFPPMETCLLRTSQPFGLSSLSGTTTLVSRTAISFFRFRFCCRSLEKLRHSEKYFLPIVLNDICRREIEHDLSPVTSVTSAPTEMRWWCHWFFLFDGWARRKRVIDCSSNDLIHRSWRW